MQLALQLPQPRGEVRRRCSQIVEMAPVVRAQGLVREGAEAPGIIARPAQKAGELFQLLRGKGQDGDGRLRSLRVGERLGAQALAQGGIPGEAQFAEREAQILHRRDGLFKGPRGARVRHQAQGAQLPFGGPGEARERRKGRKGVDHQQAFQFQRHKKSPFWISMTRKGVIIYTLLQESDSKSFY